MPLHSGLLNGRDRTTLSTLYAGVQVGGREEPRLFAALRTPSLCVVSNTNPVYGGALVETSWHAATREMRELPSQTLEQF
jgi:hypothetical protein